MSDPTSSDAFPDSSASKSIEDRRHAGRRRRKKQVSGQRFGGEDWGDGSNPGTGGGWRPVAALAGVAGLALFAMLAAGTREEFLHGVLWCGLGLLLMVLPPVARVPRWWLTAGAALLLGGAGGFLPVSLVGMPEWRSALERLGLETGDRISAQPLISAEVWAGLAVSVVAGWYVMGQRIPDRAQLRLALGMALGIAFYGAVSMLAYKAKPAWSWDPVDTFGIYGNRNHTATVLVMGALTALGVMMESIRVRRGGLAGAGALALAVCLWGLLGYSVSRAGVLLLGVGVVVWLTGLGRRYLPLKALITGLVMLAVVAGVFWFADTKVKKRMVAQWELLQAKAGAALGNKSGERELDNTEPNGPSASARDSGKLLEDQPLDFRVLIFRDTLRMIQAGSWTGIGLGQFTYVFPQYRHDSANDGKRFWHPESNWLLLAVEAGWPVALIAAVAVAGLFWAAFRASRRRGRGWALALGTLLAALVVPVHGIFDVPAYHTGIAWMALVLVAMNFRPGEEPPGRDLRHRDPEDSGNERTGREGLAAGPVSRWAFRLAGVGILSAGVWLLLGLGGGRPPLALRRPAVATLEAQARIAADIAQSLNPAQNPPELNPDGTPVDQTEVAQNIVNEALKVTPLEPELHFLRGSLSVFYPGEEGITAEAFAIQRALIPDWVDVPFRQGLALVNVHPDQALACWREAFRRSRESWKIRPGADMPPEFLLRRLKALAIGKPQMQKVVKELEADAVPQG